MTQKVIQHLVDGNGTWALLEDQNPDRYSWTFDGLAVQLASVNLLSNALGDVELVDVRWTVASTGFYWRDQPIFRMEPTWEHRKARLPISTWSLRPWESEQ